MWSIDRQTTKGTRSPTAAAQSSKRIADKWPTNFLHLGLIAILFPKARIIHCKREPLDTCLSIYTQNFDGVAYSNDLRHIGLFYRQYQRLMDHWMDVLPSPIHQLHYEAVVQDQENTTRELLNYCGLPWVPECLDFHATSRAVKTASMEQVRKPIYSQSIGRWQHFSKHLAPLQQALAGD